MCGIVGIAGDLWYKEEKTMQRLFLLDYFRGTDSTGLAAVRNTGEIKVAKLASDPITLFQMASFKEALNGNNSKLFLGHNRAATRGVVNNYNAHPFHIDHIVGVHNGTLEGPDKLVLENKLGRKFDVDSEALIASIAKFGVKETITSIHEGRDYQTGAWALAWYDETEDTLNFLRNKHRPLWYAFDKGFKRIIFASNWQMINHAAEMSDPAYELERYEYAKNKGHFYRFMSVPENMHLKFELGLLKKGSDTKPKPKAVEIKGKEPSAAVNKQPSLYDPFQRNGNIGVHTNSSNTTSGGTNSTTPSRSNSNDNADRLVHYYGSDELPYGDILPVFGFMELTQGGCSWCSEDIRYGDPGIVVYDRQDTILCKKCAHGNTSAAVPAAKVYVSRENFKPHAVRMNA
jgi:predicted glutamine amidotransferase